MSQICSPSNIRVAFLCSLYMLVGPTLVFVTRHILKTMSFPYPMFLSGLGVFISFVSSRIAVRLNIIQVQKKEQVEGILWYKRVMPIGFAQACTIAFANMAYLHLNVGIIQMLKSFSPVVIIIVGYLSGMDSYKLTDGYVICAILIICFGTAMTCSYHLDLTYFGLFIMIISEVADAVRLIFMQYFLHNLKLSAVDSMYILAPASALWLLFASFLFEFRSMNDTKAFSILIENPMIFVAAFPLGLAVNSLTFMVIQYTSSLTAKVISTLHNIVTIALGVMFYSEAVSVLEVIGYIISLGGFLFYNAVKIGYFENWPVEQLYLLNIPLALSQVLLRVTSPAWILCKDFARIAAANNSLCALLLQFLTSIVSNAAAVAACTLGEIRKRIRSYFEDVWGTDVTTLPDLEDGSETQPLVATTLENNVAQAIPSLNALLTGQCSCPSPTTSIAVSPIMTRNTAYVVAVFGLFCGSSLGLYMISVGCDSARYNGHFCFIFG